MKQNIGAQLALYPSPVTVVGAMVDGKPASYTWTEEEVLGYELESTVTEGNVTVITNKPWSRDEKPKQGAKPKLPGNPLYSFDDYETPLGVDVIINHVGDCFD